MFKFLYEFRARASPFIWIGLSRFRKLFQMTTNATDLKSTTINSEKLTENEIQCFKIHSKNEFIQISSVNL